MSNNDEWIKINSLAEHLFHTSDLVCQLLKGDGSDRKIYRINPTTDPGKSVVGIYHEDIQENESFLNFTEHLSNYNIPVAKIFLVSDDRRIYFMQDLGPYTLAETIDMWKQSGRDHQILPAYKRVLDYLYQMQQIPLEKSTLLTSQMAVDTYLSDLEYFERCFIRAFGQSSLFSVAAKNELEKNLVGTLLELEHEFFVYRDFQARNIMWLDNTPWFIDYQSAMQGSMLYDVASLLYGSKSGLEEGEREELIRYYYDISDYAGRFEEYQDYFFRFVVIRRLRSLGTYGYLSLEKNKLQFRAAIPQTLYELDNLLRNQESLSPFKAVADMIRYLKEQPEITEPPC